MTRNPIRIKRIVTAMLKNQSLLKRRQYGLTYEARVYQALTYTTQIGKGSSVKLPPNAPNWPLGSRLFWRLTSAGGLQVSSYPQGAFRFGKYQSSWVKKLGYWNPQNTHSHASHRPATVLHRLRIRERIQQVSQACTSRRKS